VIIETVPLGETVARSPPDYRKSLRRLSVVRKRRCSICAGYL
jgi:hypothetical protein